MDKRIVKLSAGKHFSVDLADRPLSIFVDGDTGVIFFDEGAGPGRVSGGVLTPEARPHFAIRNGPGESVVEIEFSGRRLEVGTCDRDTLLQQDGSEIVNALWGNGVFLWAEQVNALLLSKITESASAAPLENKPKPTGKELASTAIGEPN